MLYLGFLGFVWGWVIRWWSVLGSWVCGGVCWLRRLYFGLDCGGLALRWFSGIGLKLWVLLVV